MSLRSLELYKYLSHVLVSQPSMCDCERTNGYVKLSDIARLPASVRFQATLGNTDAFVDFVSKGSASKRFEWYTTDDNELYVRCTRRVP